MAENKNIEVGGRLHSIATGNVLVGANEIFDDDKNKKQSQINTETYSLVEEVNAKLNTLSPDQQAALDVAGKANNNEVKLGYYVCGTEGNVAAKVIPNITGYVLSVGGSMKVKMTNANTADNATLNINSTGAKALYYDGERASANNSWGVGETVEVYYDGTSYYANSVAGGSSDGIFDVSIKYPTSGVEGGNTYTLEGALLVLNTNLPSSKKKGGMSIKFIQTSDNKYVQCRYMGTATTGSPNPFLDTANWQGVDSEITAGSKNLAESGAVAAEFAKKFNEGADVTNFTDYTIWNGTSQTVTINGKVVTIVAPGSNVNTQLYFATENGKEYHVECEVSNPSANLVLSVWNNSEYPNIPQSAISGTQKIVEPPISGNKFICSFVARGPQSIIRISTGANSTNVYTFSITAAGDGKLKDAMMPTTYATAIAENTAAIGQNTEAIGQNTEDIKDLKEESGKVDAITDLFVLDTSSPIASADSYGQTTLFADCTLTIQDKGFTWTQGQSANYSIYFKFPTVAGEKYAVSLKVVQGSFTAAQAYNNQNYPDAPSISAGNKLADLVAGENGIYTAEFTATGVESYVRFQIPFNTVTLKVEDFGYAADSEKNAYLKPTALPNEIPTDKINWIKVLNKVLYLVQGSGDFWLYNHGLFDSNLKDTEYSLSSFNSAVISTSTANTCPTKVLARTNGGVIADRGVGVDIWSKNGKIANRIELSFKCSSLPSNPSQTVKVLFVGDSLIGRGYMTQDFLDMLNTLGLTHVELIGRTYKTLTTNRFEGTGGYAWNNYVCDPATLPQNYNQNYFWNANKLPTAGIDAQYYVDTYCNGATPDFVICNLGWNHVVNSAYSVDYDIDTIEGYVKAFIDEIHNAFPSCRVILNGMHLGNPDYPLPATNWNIRLLELNELYYNIATMSDYSSFVSYCDVAPYFDGRTGMSTDVRVKNQWTAETETYVTDFVHPNEIGFNMHAKAVLECFLYNLYKVLNP